MKKLMIIATILLLSACSVGKLSRPGATQADYDRDMYDCQSKNRTASPAMALVDLDNTFKCMQYEHGWTRGGQ